MGVRQMPGADASGGPQFAGMGIASGGSGGGGGGDIAFSSEERKIGTFMGVDMYAKVLDVTWAPSWTTIESNSDKYPVMGFVSGTDTSNSHRYAVYANMVRTGDGRLQYKALESVSGLDNVYLLVVYTKSVLS